MARDIEEHLSVHDRLKRLERAVQLQEDRESANLRRIEQLAARVRELEMAKELADDYAMEQRERAGE